MKKVFISILSLCALVANAQQDAVTEETVIVKQGSSAGGFMANSNKDLSFTSKNGYEVLPQAGDWGIGISATGPLNYVGSFIGQNAGTTDAFDGVDGTSGSNTTIFGKYFVNSHTAYRGWVSTENTRTTYSVETVDDGDATNTAQAIYDKQVEKSRGVMLGAGLEKRRGHGRLIGIYGAEAFLGFNQGSITTNKYANELNATNPFASTSVGGSTTSIGTVDGIDYYRTLSNNTGSTFTIGAQAFIGVEYFVAPKLSIGGEFNLGLSYVPNLKETIVVEYFNASNGAVEEFVQKNDSGSNVVDFSTSNAFSGTLKLNFHF